MAQLKKKVAKRCRIQFSMNFALFERYSICRNRAKKLGLLLDMSSDFEAWFAGQLEQIELKLEQLDSNEREGQNER